MRTKWLVRLWHREPRQMALPFHCELYGETCGPFYHLNSGFYGRCVNCGVTYDPVNDR